MRASDVVVGGGTTTATDLSGNGLDLVNGGAAGTQPALTTFPVTGAPSLYWDGDDLLDCGSALLPVTSGIVYTLIWVTTYDDLVARYFFDSNIDGTGNSGIAVGQSVGTAGKSQEWLKGHDRYAWGDAVANTPQWGLATFKVAGAYTKKIWVNNVEQTLDSPTAQVTAPAGTTWGVGRYASGSAFYHKGHYPEGLLVLGDVSGLRTKINGYMQKRYGTA